MMHASSSKIDFIFESLSVLGYIPSFKRTLQNLHPGYFQRWFCVDSGGFGWIRVDSGWIRLDSGGFGVDSGGFG